MKSRLILVITIIAVIVAIASQNCPFGKSACQTICQRSGACELGKGCGIKNKEKDQDKDKGCEKDKEKDKDPNCEKDPNSDS
jgi:hypothetical protein